MTKANIAAIVAAGVFIMFPPHAVQADPGHDHGKGHDKHEDRGHDDHGRDKHSGKRHHFSNHDRIAAQGYLEGDYREHCPPGLAKKHNGCRPPGHAKRYRIGYPLTVVYQPVPEPLYVQLEEPPVGYQYVMVDSDVLLISEASHHVIDAITLLSAVGR